MSKELLNYYSRTRRMGKPFKELGLEHMNGSCPIIPSVLDRNMVHDKNIQVPYGHSTTVYQSCVFFPLQPLSICMSEHFEFQRLIIWRKFAKVQNLMKVLFRSITNLESYLLKMFSLHATAKELSPT